MAPRLTLEVGTPHNTTEDSDSAPEKRTRAGTTREVVHYHCDYGGAGHMKLRRKHC